MSKRAILLLFLFTCAFTKPAISQSSEREPLSYLLQLQVDSLHNYLQLSTETSYSNFKSATYYHLLRCILYFNKEEVDLFFTDQSKLYDMVNSNQTSTNKNILQLDICLNNLVIASIASNHSQLMRAGIQYRNLLGKLSDKDSTRAAYYKHKAIEQVMFAVVINEVPLSKLLIGKDYAEAQAWYFFDKGKHCSSGPLEYNELVVWEQLLRLHFGENTQLEASSNEPLYQLMNVLAARKLNQNDSVLEWTSSFEKTQYQAFPFLYLLQAEALLRKLDSSCISLYKQYLSTTKSELFYNMASKQLTWAYTVFNVSSKTIYPEESYAWLAIDRSFLAEPLYAANDAFLLRARLLFDGGYYHEALKVFNEHTVLPGTATFREYAYRKARVYHLLNRNNEAILSYNSAMEHSDKSNEYAAKACYFAGRLSQETGYTHLAAYYFTKLKAYKDFPFEQALKRDASARLQILKNQ